MNSPKKINPKIPKIFQFIFEIIEKIHRKAQKSKN